MVSIQCKKSQMEYQKSKLRKSNQIRILELVGSILFFLMLVSPRTNQVFKIPELAILCLWAVSIIWRRRKINLRVPIIRWFLLFMFYGIFWGVFGILNNKEFALDFIRLFFIWVLIFLLLVSLISEIRHFNRIREIFLWATLFISIYNINFFLYSVGFIHIPLLLYFDAGQRIGLHPGYVQLTAHNIGSLFFLIPFLFCEIIQNRDGKSRGYSSKFTIFVLTLASITVFLSGRRVLWIIFILTPLIYYLLIYISNSGKISKRQIVRFLSFSIIAGLLTFFVLFVLMGLDINVFISRLTFSGSEGVGVSYRIQQTLNLIRQVYRENILFGTGGGSEAFEIIFVQSLNETGIVGLSIFVGLFTWVLHSLIKLIKKNPACRDFGIPLTVGFLCFIFALFSNPYFSSFDFMWTLFLPVAFVNFYLLESNSPVKISCQTDNSPRGENKLSKGEICAVVITYNGLPNIAETLQKILENVGMVFIIDNGSTDGTQQFLKQVISKKVVLTFLENNFGIAYALNRGTELAHSYGYNWILTMDQDSLIDSNMIREMIKVYNSLPDFERNFIGALSPKINYYGKNVREKSQSMNYFEKRVVITSGNLVKTSVIIEIGGYNEKYFIDSVDFDFCLKLRKNNYKILVCENSLMYHSLGKVVEKKFFGININLHLHSETRKYYISRNHIFILKEYLISDFIFCLKKSVFFLIFIFQTILFEKNRLRNLRVIWKGIIDGFMDKFGE